MLQKVAVATGVLLLVLLGSVHAHPNSTFQIIADDILTPSCFAGCHGTSGNAMQVNDPSEGAWYDALVNQAPANAAASGVGKLRVDAGRPWNSFLVDKLTGDLKLAEGDPMPRFSHGYVFDCPGGVEKIKAWIFAGAPHTGIVPGDFDPTGIVCEKSQPSLTSPAPPADGIQLAGASFTVERPLREGKQITSASVGLTPLCDNNLQRCFITGVEIAASAGTEYVTVSRDGESTPIAVARGEQASLSLPSGVGVPIAPGQQLEIRQRIRNDYWIGPTPYTNKTTGLVFVNVHVASSVASEAQPFRDDTGSQALLVPPQSYGTTGGVWLPSGPGSPAHALVGIWSDRRVLRTELLDAAGKTPPDGSTVEHGYTETGGPPVFYSCVHANGWVPNRFAAIASNGTNAILNSETGPVDLSAPLKWGCEQQPTVPPGLPAPAGSAAISCARSSDSSFSGNDCSDAGGTQRCQPANLVFGPSVEDGRCALVGLWW